MARTFFLRKPARSFSSSLVSWGDVSMIWFGESRLLMLSLLATLFLASSFSLFSYSCMIIFSERLNQKFRRSRAKMMEPNTMERVVQRPPMKDRKSVRL